MNDQEISADLDVLARALRFFRDVIEKAAHWTSDCEEENARARLAIIRLRSQKTEETQ